MGDNLRGRVATKTAPRVAEEEPAVPEQAPAPVAEEIDEGPIGYALAVPEPEPEAEPTPEAVPVHVALARVMAEARAVAKRDKHDAPGAKFMFRGIDAVMNVVGPALRKHGVLVMPELLSVGYRDVQTSGGKPSRECTVQVRYTFIGPDGTTLSTVVPGESMDSGDKGTAKAMSVAMRIALLQALALPTDEPDPDSYHYEREAPAPAPSSIALGELQSLTAARGWNPKTVSNAFWVQYGVTPLEARADQLRAFTAALEAAPDTVLALADQVKAAPEQAAG